MRIAVHMPEGGIGDLCISLTAVAGLRRDFPSADILLQCQPDKLPWLTPFTDCRFIDSAVYPVFADAHYHPYETYRKEITERLERATLYSAECGTSPALPAFTLPPPRKPGSILLFPFSNKSGRTWSLVGWLHLEQMLLDAGHRVYALDGQKGRLADFKHKKQGHRPEQILQYISGARLIICNDSGPAHLGGCLQKPTLALVGPVDQRLFGIYPTVRLVEGELPCKGCYWASRYCVPECVDFCANLATITPQKVMSAVTTYLHADPFC